MVQATRKCSIDGCERKHVARGLCSTHYNKKRAQSTPKCNISDCQKNVIARGYCSMHYQKLRKEGDLKVIPPSKKICTVEGCTREHHAKGLCQIHYDRLRDQGRFESYTVYYKTPEESFASRTNPTSNGCIEWTGAISTEGYGLISVNRTSTYAHRYAWERVNGAIGENQVVDHKCFNRRCVNIDHIRVTIHQKNTQHLLHGRTNNTSGYRGVSWSSRNKGYIAVVKSKGNRYQLGTFQDPKEAALVALRKRRELGFPDSIDDIRLMNDYCS